MSLVTVFQTFNPAEAQLIRSRLDAARLHPTVAGELAALSMDGYSLSTGGICVQVPDDEAKDAREIIESGTTEQP
jgi:hypothetical protein